MKAEIAALLQGDSTLTGLLTGGLYHDAPEITRQLTPAAFNEFKELLPCALLKDGTVAPIRKGSGTGLVRRSLRIFLYEQGAGATIAAAALRLYALLHEKQVTLPPTEGVCMGIEHGDDLLDQWDDGLKATLVQATYFILVRR